MGIGKGVGRGFGHGRGRGYGRGLGQGKGGFSGYACVKFVFFGFNVFFWLLGCAILGVGIWLQVTKGSFAALSPSFSFFSATALCITAGVLILVVGFFGCCGAIMESKCLLMTYFVLILVIFIFEIVGGVLAFVYGNEIETTVGDELLKGIRERYNPKPTGKPNGAATNGNGEEMHYEEDADLKAVWSYTQSTFKCCGVYNYSDWDEILPGTIKVPKECCKTNTSDCNTSDEPHKWYSEGCLEKVKTRLKNNLYILGIVGICVGLLQILGLIASMALFCCLRREKYYDE